MSKKQWFKTFIIVISVVLTSACSKKLLPPEIEMASGAGSMSESGLSDSSDESDASDSSLGGSDGSFAADPQIEKGGSGQPSIFTESNVDSGGKALSGDFDGTFDSAGGNLSGPASRNFGSDGSFKQPGDGYYGHYAADGSTSGFEKNATDLSGAGNADGFGNGGDLPLSDRRDFGSGAGLEEPGDGYYGKYSADGTPLSPSASGSAASGGHHDATTGANLGAQVQEGIQEARLLPFKSTASLGDVYFGYDKYNIDGNFMNVLQQNAGYLKKRPNVKVEIQGHCDERGTNNYNIALGERRANAIKRKLMSLGIDGKRLHTISYGEEKPFCFEGNEACWRENRRGHFMVTE